MMAQNKFTTEDQRWMRRALSVAENAIFVSDPNPRVGCVLVKNGRWLADGFTQKAGSDHAEIQAIKNAHANGLDVAGATAYVTLEPCSHTGRTKPCVNALIAAKVKRVVVALQDPNPLVAGNGVARLRGVGISVDVGLFAEDSLALNQGFVARMVRGTPWLWLKSAASMDGFTALDNGQSKWITGNSARQDGHYWRAKSSMVLTGIGTITVDDPILNARYVDTPRQPTRGILDSNLIVAEQAKIFNGDPVYLFTCSTNNLKKERLADKNVRVIQLPSDAYGRVELKALMRWLGDNEFNEIHVEAGAKLQGALLANDLVDQWVAYIAPCILGSGLGLANLPTPLNNLDQAYRFEFLSSLPFGSDLRLLLQHKGHWQALKQACGL